MPRKHLLLLGLVTACGGGAGTAASDSATAAITAESTTTTVAPAGAKSAEATAPAVTTVALDTAALASDQPLLRETFGYDVTSRDPFRAVISADSRGPELPDLRLVGIIYDERSPANSVATFRDIGSKLRFNVRPGDRIGRILVASVQQTDVVLRMNDFGTVREQTYSLRKTEDENK